MASTKMEANEFVAAKRLADSARFAIQKLEKVLYKTMTPTLAKDLKLDEISAGLDGCLARIREQQNKHPSTYLPGACDEVALPDPTPVMVDSRGALTDMLVSMAGALDTPNAAADLSVDLEGYHLSRHGTISLVQIFVHATNVVYLVHVAVLKAAAFSTPVAATSGIFKGMPLTLKTVLESSAVTKLFWDCRGDSDALYHLYGVKLAGVIDVQLWDLATRESSKERAKVKSLSHAFTQRMRRDLSEATIESWSLIKDAGKRAHEASEYEEAEQWYIQAGGKLLEVTSSKRQDSVGSQDSDSGNESPSKGKDAFAQSPLRPLLQAYAVNDVRVLPVMLEHFTIKHRFWNDDWQVRVCTASEDRIEEGISPRFNASAAASGVKNEAPAGWKDVVQVDRFAAS
jgi:exonuclease 3'-5' domain-containing protein 1